MVKSLQNFDKKDIFDYNGVVEDVLFCVNGILAVEIEKSRGQIQKLRPFLPEKTQEELDEILAYGEKIKVRGERKKKERWSDHSREDFKKLLKYKQDHEGELESQYKYLEGMSRLERKKFINEYLYNDMLYSGKLDEIEVEEKEYSYEDWKNGNVVMEEGVDLAFGYESFGDEGLKAIVEKMELKDGVALDLENNEIGLEGAKLISKMELKEGVELDLRENEIGDEGAKAIAGMELKEGVYLNLQDNGIGAEGAKAVAENLKLKKGVILDLSRNSIGDEGAKSIIENMRLVEGVELNLKYNQISKNMKDKLRKRNEKRIEKGINCEVITD